MFRVLLLLLISANLPFAYCQDNELDCPYFGLEFVDVDGAIKISGIDVDIPSAKKLQVNDVVLTANESKFETAADLNAFLMQPQHFQPLPAPALAGQHTDYRYYLLLILCKCHRTQFRSQRNRYMRSRCFDYRHQ